MVSPRPTTWILLTQPIWTCYTCQIHFYSNNQRDIFQSYLQSVNFPDPVSSGRMNESTSHPIGSLVSLLLNDSQVRPDQAQPPLNIESVARPGETSSFLRQNLDSSVVTPEEVSNITSSDAATVHSSTSGTFEVSLIFL